MSNLEVTAHMTIRKGQVDGFRRKAAEIIEQARQLDTKTLRYDWYINDDQTACEVRELYTSPMGLVEHRMHVGKAIDELFADFADDHAITVYGEPTPELLALAAHTANVDITWHSPLVR